MTNSQQQLDVLYRRGAASPTSGGDQAVRSVPGLALVLVRARKRRRRRRWKLGPLLVAHGVNERSHLRLRRVHLVEERVDFSGGEHSTTGGHSQTRRELGGGEKKDGSSLLFQDGHDGFQNGIKDVYEDGVSCYGRVSG